jgi:hypothetical protein
VKFHAIPLDDKPYQQTKIPQGAAPVSIEKDGKGFALVYIGESVLEAPVHTEVGVYIYKTGEEIPEEVRVLPVIHQLTGQPLPPNARYVGSVGNRHLVLGNPKIDSASGLIV